MDIFTFAEACSHFWQYRFIWQPVKVATPDFLVLYVASAQRRCGHNLAIVVSDCATTAWRELLRQISEYEQQRWK